MTVRRSAAVAAVILTALLILGCDFDWLIIDQNQKNPPAKTQEQPAESTPGGSSQPAPAQDPVAEVNLAGTWTGTMAFTDYTMLIKDKTAAQQFSDGIEDTLEEPYPIVITVDSDDPAGSPASMRFGEEPVIRGAVSRSGHTVTFSFKRAGTKKMTIGATPPVSFTLTGSIGSGSALRGLVVYTVLQSNGSRAWVQNGRWDAAR